MKVFATLMIAFGVLTNAEISPPLTCETFDCGEGNTCEVMPCDSPPCPIRCVRINPPGTVNPCIFTLCPVGTTCEVLQICTASIPPLCQDTDRANCIPNDPTPPSGGKTCKLKDVCKSASSRKSCRKANKCCKWNRLFGKCLVRFRRKSCFALDTVPCNSGLVCPEPIGDFGLCAELCPLDGPCPDGQLCCSNGCGRQCVDGVPP